MGRKKKNRVYVGIDGIDIKVNTTIILEKNYYAFKNKNGEEVGTLKAVKDGYLLHLCLPKVLRNDNITPFTITDFKHMESVLKYIQKQLKTIFGNEIYDTTVRTCEVNATAELSDVNKIEPMLKLLAKILLTKGEKLFICATGEQTGKRYEAVKCLCSGQRIESIKTAQLSNSRVKLKLYDKSKEQNITDRGLLRIQSLPDAPPLICLSELAEKTQLPFQMLRTLIVIEGKIPYIMVGKKYFVNYSHFIKYMDELD